MAKGKFYLIKLVSDDAFIDGKSLIDISREIMPSLAEREYQRVNILYSCDPNKPLPESIKRKYDEHVLRTQEVYDTLMLPYYLVTYEDGKNLKEFITGTVIKCDSPNEITRDKALEYLDNNYQAKVMRYFGMIQDKKDTPKTLDQDFISGMELYIDGYIDGKPISGDFKGKIKIIKWKQ